MTAPALALLTAAFTLLGALATILAPTPATPGLSLEPALGLELVPSGFAPWLWSDGAVLPAGAQEAGLEGLVFTTAAFLALGAAAALLGLAGLWTGEAAERRTELAVRRAVGASRGRLLRDGLAETLALVLLAAGLGVLGAALLGALVHATWPGPAAASPSDALPLGAATLLAGAAVATLVRALAFSTELASGGALRADAALTGGGRKPAYPLLSVLQVGAVASVLATALALPGSPGTSSALAEPAGDGYLRLGLRSPAAGEAGESDAAPDLASLLAAGRALPGVTAAGFASDGAILGLGVTHHAMTDCGDCYAGGMPIPFKGAGVVHHLATADTFDALGLEVLRGRAFRPGDGPASEPVAVVSRSFARANYQDGDPLGRGIKVGERLDAWYTVVGVVEDAPRWAIGAVQQPRGEVWLSALQHAPRRGDLLVAGAPDPEALAARVREAGWSVAEAGPLEAHRARRLAPLRWFAGAWSGLGLLILAVAVYGVFSTMRLTVRREIRDVGIRRALGARRGRILLRYLAAGLMLGGAGTLLGLWLALFALPHLPAPPGTGAGAAAAVLGVVVAPLLAASGAGALEPAWRAARAAPRTAIEGP